MRSLTWKYIFRLLYICIISSVCIRITETTPRKQVLPFDYSTVAANGSYSCDELTRWIGTEKHYSNDKKELLFSFLRRTNCKQNPHPVIIIDYLSYAWSSSGRRLFFHQPKSATACIAPKDTYAVVYLSNYSINNNFSHFLHGLLRLFCALVDARWLVWDHNADTFIPAVNYTIWLDEYFRLTPEKSKWISALGSQVRTLKDINKGQCVVAERALYGSGCLKLLPPEKWFGYPGCRAGDMMPAFGHYMRMKFIGQHAKDLMLIDEHTAHRTDPGLKVAFAVRAVGPTTGRRVISNLHDLQTRLRHSQHIRTSAENVTFEHLDVPSTIRYMSAVHVFVSVHGAGMTNMFFMNRGSAVVEIIPYPLCNCRSPDYFYGIGGYYHGSSVAQGIRHYPYCVPEKDTVWHKVPDNLSSDMFCSWKLLHAVDSVHIDPTMFLSLMRLVERDLIASGIVELTQPIIHMSPHANG